MPIFVYAIANHIRRPLYYFSLDSRHTYLPTSSSYSGYPPFFMAFVNSNHYVVLPFKKFNGSIPAPCIDGWWLRKSSSKNKNVWLQSLENDLKLFQKLMPSSTGLTKYSNACSLRKVSIRSDLINCSLENLALNNVTFTWGSNIIPRRKEGQFRNSLK
ncbi:hypothetical protein BY996DRAFT_6439094 [Phakopsora pachyrhizi]|nr:hypothetical protein BY996DRAFT_6439094 [Phakopsora pachyrhizi]